MRRRTSVRFGVAAVLASGLALWLAFASRGAAPRDDRDVGEGTRASVAPPPVAAPTLAAAPARAPVPEGTPSLAGRVTHAATGRPVPGAVVTAIRRAEGGHARAETTADEDGRYALRDLRPGPWRAFATAGGLATVGLTGSRPDGYDPLEVVVEKGRTTTLDLVLTQGAVATGRVLDADGAPFAGALVEAVPLAWSERATWKPVATAIPSATSGPDGAFRIEAIPPDEDVQVEASSSERLRAVAGPFRAAAGTEFRAEIRFAAVRFVDVAVVAAEDGAPVPKAQVLGWWATGPGSWKGFDERWTTDDAGKVRAGPFPAGLVRVSAEPFGRYVLPPVASDAIPEAQTSVVLRLPGGAQAGAPFPPRPRGPQDMRWPARVVGPDGQPVPLGWAAHYDVSGSSGGGVQDGWADLRLRGPAEDRWVEAFGAKGSDDQPLPFGPVRVRGVTQAPVELVLPPERAISGRVLGPDGRGVPGVLVIAAPDWWRGTQMRRAWPLGHSTARTDAAGAFRLGCLADTEYDVEVRPPPSMGGGPARAVHAGAADVLMRLAASLVAAVTVLDDRGLPVAGAHVRVGPKGAFEASASSARIAEVVDRATDAEGRAVFDALDPDRPYEVSVEPPPARSELERPPARLWHAQDETIRLARTWTIRGVVRSRAGDAVPGATVYLVTGSAVGAGQRVLASRFVARSAADGSFTLRRDSQDPVRLRAALAGASPSGDPDAGTVWATPGGPDVVLVVAEAR